MGFNRCNLTLTLWRQLHSTKEEILACIDKYWPSDLCFQVDSVQFSGQKHSWQVSQVHLKQNKEIKKKGKKTREKTHGRCLGWASWPHLTSNNLSLSSANTAPQYFITLHCFRRRFFKRDPNDPKRPSTTTLLMPWSYLVRYSRWYL